MIMSMPQIMVAINCCLSIIIPPMQILSEGHRPPESILCVYLRMPLSEPILYHVDKH